MAVEIVIVIPLLVALMLLVVAFGRMVDTYGDVEAVSRDAVRAASLERSQAEGVDAMKAIIDASLPSDVECPEVQLNGNFSPGGVITVDMQCEVSYEGLGLIGLPGSVSFERSSSAPIDTWRRTE